MFNENVKKLTTIEKKKGVIADYDDIAKEYAEEFFYKIGEAYKNLQKKH